MRRVLVFGNSHVAAWSAGWGEMAPGVAGVELAFFCLPERIFQRYRRRSNGLFAPRRSVTAEELDRVRAMNGGAVDCDLAGADLVVCVGAGWQPERAVAFAALGEGPWAAGDGGGSGRAVFGPGFVQAALEEVCAEAVAGWPVAGPVAGRRPVVFGRPVYAETCLASQHRAYAPWRAAAPYPEAAAGFLRAYRARLAGYAAAQGMDFLAPPEAVAGDMGLTRAEYLAEGGGVVSPEAPGARGDHIHMNAAYGRACLGRLLDHLAGADTAAVA